MDPQEGVSEDLEVGVAVFEESIDIIMVTFEFGGLFECGFYPDEEGSGVVIPHAQRSVVRGVIIWWSGN